MKKKQILYVITGHFSTEDGDHGMIKSEIYADRFEAIKRATELIEDEVKAEEGCDSIIVSSNEEAERLINVGEDRVYVYINDMVHNSVAYLYQWENCSIDYYEIEVQTIKTEIEIN